MNLESRIERFGGREREELEMMLDSGLSRQRERMPSQASFGGFTAGNSEEMLTFERNGDSHNLTELIVLDEAIDPQYFIDNIMSEMGDSIEFIQEDIRMELAEFERFEIDLNIDFENNMATTDFASAETIVAVIDTGIDTSHPLLHGRLTNGFDFVNNTQNVFNPDLGAEQNHGTHIAGVIAQTADNARIMPLKVFENGVAYTSDIIAAIQFAEANGARIVNASWGAAGYNPALREVIENSSMFFVAAAGNHRVNLSETPILPASFDLSNVISVGSTNQDFGMSFFSNFGPVDIAAVGRNVEGAVVGGGFGAMTGTSVSAAFVSAAASMSDAEDLRYALMSSSDSLSSLQSWVTDGNFLNIDNLRNGVVGQWIEVDYEDDFDRWFERTPEESWELFNASPIVQVVAGSGHTVALKANGTVWTWGNNMFAQLGTGNNASRRIPTQVVGLANIQSITAGVAHNLVLTRNGDVFAWGTNLFGEIGDGTTIIDRHRPTLNPVLSGVISIEAGDFTSTAIRENNDVYAWGFNQDGRLGDGSTTHRNTPTPIEFGDVIFISTGVRHTAAIRENNNVYAWGLNGSGQLGDGTTANRRIPTLSGLNGVSMVALGFEHTVALTKNGAVYAWGDNRNGQLGDGSAIINNLAPIPIGFNNVISIAAGSDHTVALTYGGYIYSWGRNNLGQLGDGTNNDTNTPTRTINISGVTAIAAGGNHTLAITNDGYVYAWGNNADGRLGLGTSGGSYNIPQRVQRDDGDYFNVYTSGMTLSTQRLTSSGIVTATAVMGSVTEHTPAFNAVVIMSLHRIVGNTMVAIDHQARTINPGQVEVITTSVDVPANFRDYYVRVMIWDSLDGMNQIHRSVILDADGIHTDGRR